MARTELGSTPAEIPAKLRAEFLKRPFDPEVVTATWRAFFPEATIPDCDWPGHDTYKSVYSMGHNAHTPLLVPVPEIYRGQEGLVRLGRRFPQLKSRGVMEGAPVVSDERDDEWVKIENSPLSPNSNYSSKALEAGFEGGKFVGQRLVTFVLGSTFYHEMYGSYFDTNTSSLLYGSRFEWGDPVVAGFTPDGRLDFARHKTLGARTETSHPRK